MKLLLIFLSCIVCIEGCDDQKIPSGILPKEKMQAVMWDLIQAQAFTNYYAKKDSIKNKHLDLEDAKLQAQVFLLNGISKQDYYKSYDYYKAHMALMKDMVDSMAAKAGRDEAKFIEPAMAPKNSSFHKRIR